MVFGSDMPGSRADGSAQSLRNRNVAATTLETVSFTGTEGHTSALAKHLLHAEQCMTDLNSTLRLGYSSGEAEPGTGG